VIFRNTILFFISFLLSVSSEVTASNLDTIKLVEGSRLHINDQKIRIRQDTVIIIPPGEVYTVKTPRGNGGEIFFDSLQVKAGRKQWTRRLHNIVVREPRNLVAEDTVHTRLSTEPFQPYSGKIIRNISFNKLQPFGTSLRNQNPESANKMEKFGNDIHRITQDKVFRKYLLFKEGDFVNPDEFADNERIIRKLPFIQDAFLDIRETSPGSDSVDIILVSKDVFFLGLGGEVLDFNAGNLEIFNPNLSGLGHELHTVFHWDGERDHWMGNEIFYIINNIGGSFIDSKMRYANVFNTETYEFGLDRKFFTPDTKSAGALDIERTQAKRNIFLPDTIYKSISIKYSLFDGWIGRSILLSRKQNLLQSRSNLVFATRLYRTHFTERPEVTRSSLYSYQNNTTWLSSISYSAQSFFKSNLIRDFGRTEDIPQGTLFSLTAGPEFNEFGDRFYTGLSISHGRYLGNIGYIYSRIEGGGFFEEQDYVEQGVVNLKLDYFSNLFILNRFKLRHFISANYVRGIRRFDDEFVDLRDDYGIRGFRSREVTGTQKLAINYEATAFTPYYLYGFRFVLFGFADAGIIGPDIEPVHDGQFYSGFGLGVRIRNERLIFETISIRIGFYPNHPDIDPPLLLNIAGRERLNPENFRVKKPKIIGFR
jgi:hypothetical protein